MPPLVVMPAKNLERLTVRFRSALSKSPSDGEPNLSGLLRHISHPFAGDHRGDLGVLNRLSSITIEIHDIPARYLGEDGIKKDEVMWDRLDRVLSREGGYVPNLEQLDLKLFLRSGESVTAEIQPAISRLLPSLGPSVRRITVSTAERW